MSLTAPQTTIDPLRSFTAGGFVAGTRWPVPLLATRFDVVIEAGLAVVSTTRIFRNAEAASIEATITFPVPVHATLFALRARIGDRVLDARAKRRDAAREDYERALEGGKTAVLHEEVLRGVHMLSIGHVAPGVDIEVRVSFAITLTNLDGRGSLRIPLTVGDIYGRSGMPDSDDLAAGGTLALADLAVDCRDGSVALIGGQLEGGRAKIALDGPIDLEVSGWTPRDLAGRAADGRAVTLRVEPTAAGEVALDAAILVDHSGSMQEICSAGRAGLTKHQAVVAGLAVVARDLAASDMVDLWEFDDSLTLVGSTRDGDGRGGDQNLLALLRGLSGPRGGTEIGRALDHIVGGSEAPDVLLITDGKSHALDVQALARCGRRFAVVLVGEDSLEANVGHLAALTGGEIFVAAGPDLAATLTAGVRSLKVPHQAPAPIDGIPQGVSVRRAGMTISAAWRPTGAAIDDTLAARAVAAMAASLALPAMPADRAAALAEAEGLVTHLTSLILVDEAAADLGSIPATRKIALPTPRTAVSRACAAMPAEMMPAYLAAAPASAAEARGRVAARKPSGGDVAGRKYSVEADEPSRDRSRELQAPRSKAVQVPSRSPQMIFPRRAAVDADGLAGAIDWDLAPQRLQVGDLAGLGPAIAQAIRAAAARADVIDLAKRLALDPVVLVIGLLARAQAYRNRSAARVARAIFGDRPRREVDEVAGQLRLE